MKDISFKICNNPEDIAELMWIDEPQTVSIFIHHDSIIVCADNGKKNVVKVFETNTNLFDVRIWIEKFLEK